MEPIFDGTEDDEHLFLEAFYAGRRRWVVLDWRRYEYTLCVRRVWWQRGRWHVEVCHPRNRRESLAVRLPAYAIYSHVAWCAKVMRNGPSAAGINYHPDT